MTLDDILSTLDQLGDAYQVGTLDREHFLRQTSPLLAQQVGVSAAVFLEGIGVYDHAPGGREAVDVLGEDDDWNDNEEDES